MEPVTIVTILAVAKVTKMLLPKHVPNYCMKCSHENAKSAKWCEKCGAGMRSYNSEEIKERNEIRDRNRIEEKAIDRRKYDEIISKKEDKARERVERNVKKKMKELGMVKYCKKCDYETKKEILFCSECGGKLDGLSGEEVNLRIEKFKSTFWARI